ncbi:MAG: TetR/AcrR family transcriptional regulator [Clostridia bacterium]
MNTNDKRERILTAAIDLFYEVGLDNGSIADIAEKAQVAKGTVYLYFSSKEQLIEAAFWQCHRHDVEACQAGLDRIESAIGKLERRMENVVRWALNNPKEIRMERMYFSSPKFGQGSRYQQQFLQFEPVDTIIRQGIARGEIKDLPSSLLGEMFFGIGAAALNYVVDVPDALEDENFWRACRESVAGCLKPL